MSTPAKDPPNTPRKAGKKRKSAGRPRYAVKDADRVTVRALSTAGLDQDMIADYLNIAPKTLRQYFRRELDLSLVDIFGGCMRGLVALINKNDLGAICFFMKTRGRRLHNGDGWLERQEITGPGGGAIPVRLSSLTDAQLAQLADRLQEG